MSWNWNTSRHLDRQTKTLYRRVIRGVTRAARRPEAAFFATATGTPNQIVSHDRQRILVRASRPAFNASSSRQPEFQVERAQIRVAVELLVVEGLVDRKCLEKSGSPFSSAIMGLLLTFLGKLVRRLVLRTGRIMIRLTNTRVYLAGAERDPAVLDLLDRAGGCFVLFNFYHLRDNLQGRNGALPAWLRHIEQKGMVLLVDSGAYSVKQGKPPITLDEYFEFLDRFPQITRYFVLDVIGDPKATKENLLTMLERGRTPIPIFQAGAPWEDLDWLIEMDFDLIGIGGTVFLSEDEKRRFFDELFSRYPDHPFHGLGVGSTFAAAYPWFSKDATSHLVGRDRPGGMGGKVLTDLGQKPSAVPSKKALPLNIGYSLDLGKRGGRGLQLRLDELLDGRVANPSAGTRLAPRIRRRPVQLPFLDMANHRTSAL